MPMTTIGDMRQHFMNLRHNSTLKQRLGTLAQELATGQMSDLTAHLGRDQTRLADIDRQIGLARTYQRASTETGQILSQMQSALSAVDHLRGAAAGPLLNVTSSTSPAQREDAAMEARASFEGTIQALNTRFGDRAIFGGADVNDSPLQNADAMLSDIRAAVGGAADASGVQAALDVWFDDPGGGFETTGYAGSTGAPVQRALGDGQTVEISARADDPALRRVLKATAMAAIANDPTLAITQDDRAVLLRSAGEALMSSATDLAGVQSTIGFIEARVEHAMTRSSAREASLGIMRNEMVTADPYETASTLEQVQLQLETHYTLTARLSRLSLTEYLR